MCQGSIYARCCVDGQHDVFIQTELELTASWLVHI